MAPSAVAEPQSQTFGYTGAAQPFVVPEGVFAITVDAYGAAGGNGESSEGGAGLGGLGGRATAIVCVEPGETLDVYVGGAGFSVPPIVGESLGGDAIDQDAQGEVSAAAASPGGFNGGGPSSDGFTPGGGGGGASDVRRGAERLVAAGGGGGGGGADDGGDPAASKGGGGGGLVGEDGTASNSFAGPTPPGLGGTQTAGGLAPTAFDATATDGSSGQGGTGGAGSNGPNDTGGGGGGGWFGGGGGAGDVDGSDDAGGGGGGSGFGPGDAVFETGVRAGDGSVVLSWDPSVVVTVCVRFTG